MAIAQCVMGQLPACLGLGDMFLDAAMNPIFLGLRARRACSHPRQQQEVDFGLIAEHLKPTLSNDFLGPDWEIPILTNTYRLRARRSHQSVM